jgi:hypothetical protein
MTKVFFCSLGALLGCSSSAPATAVSHDAGADRAGNVPDAAEDASLAPVDVPIAVSEEAVFDSMRFGVSIDVGSSSLEVQLDTGSSGLRIVEGAVPMSAFERVTTTPVVYSYHSGLIIQGVVAYATITMGGAMGSLKTPSPIPVMLIQQASCESTMPECGANGVPISQLTLFGSFKAVLGVGMRSTLIDERVGSPVAQLEGEPSFVVMAPAYGGMTGTLRLNPSASQLAGFKTFELPPLTGGAPLANGVAAFDDRYGLPACVDDETSGTDYCVPAELDTGNPPVYIEWPAHTGSETELPAGHKIDVTLGKSSAPLEEYSFTIASPPKPGIDEILVETPTGQGFMNLGTAVFFRYDVLFDPVKGVVGFSAKE